MQAIVMKGFGSIDLLSLQKAPKPSPKEGEVRIRIKAAGFNPVDWKIREGWYGGNPHQILGCDCSGTVDALGPSVTQFSIGDEVYAMTLGRSSNGSYAEFVSVPVEFVAKKPKNISFEQAATIPLASMTAYRATAAISAFKKGNTVFAAGLGGGVGSFAIQFIKMAKVKSIYTIAKDEKSALFLQNQLGIQTSQILLYQELGINDLKENLLSLNNGAFFDSTLDLVGGTIKQLCIELTGYSGHFSTILPESDFIFPIWQENAIPRARNMSIHQVAIGAELSDPRRKYWSVYQIHLSLISQMLEEGRLQPPYVQIIGSMNSKTVEQAHELLKKGHVKGKLVMVMEESR
jgi:NADPH:quinone reductase-like Zn-dependent oxidoreductase